MVTSTNPKQYTSKGTLERVLYFKNKHNEKLPVPSEKTLFHHVVLHPSGQGRDT